MLMILARLVRSESFWAVVKVRSPHNGREPGYPRPELQAALATLLRELTPSVGSSDAGLDAARELVSAAEAQHRLLTAPQAPPPELTPAPEAAPAPPERPRRHARAT